jgi:hypothetical protein
MDTAMEILEFGLEVLAVILPCQAVHARCSLTLKCVVGVCQEFDGDMVQERGEPFLL